MSVKLLLGGRQAALRESVFLPDFPSPDRRSKAPGRWLGNGEQAANSFLTWQYCISACSCLVPALTSGINLGSNLKALCCIVLYLTLSLAKTSAGDLRIKVLGNG